MMLKQRLIVIACLLLLLTVVLFSFVMTEEQKIKTINDFQSCNEAGYPIMESYPAQCKTPDGRTFTEEITNIPNQVQAPTDNPEAGSSASFCKNSCGDGVCQEVVCQAQGCACAESAANCPQDCN